MFGFVPSLKLLVKTFDKLVGNIIAKALHADAQHIVKCFDRHLICTVAVSDD